MAGWGVGAEDHPEAELASPVQDGSAERGPRPCCEAELKTKVSAALEELVRKSGRIRHRLADEKRAEGKGPP